MHMLFSYLVKSFFPVLQGDEGTAVWVSLTAGTKLSSEGQRPGIYFEEPCKAKKPSQTASYL